MKEKITLALLLLFIMIMPTCDKKPTEPEHLNPFDDQNAQTGGDPFNLTAAIANGGVTLAWTIPQVQGIAAFRIYRSASEQSGYVFIQSVDNLTSTYIDKNILNGYVYRYRISSVNSRGQETDYTNTAAVSIKTAPAFVINGGDQYTPSRLVNLTILDNTAKEMIVSNASDFAGSAWEVYTSSKEWILATGVGEKIVYLKVKYDSSESVVVSDTIDIQPIDPGIVIADDSVYTATRNVQLNLSASGSNLLMKFGVDTTFSGLDWQEYSSTADFQLPTGAGEKKVYAKFKNDFEVESGTVSDVILPLPMNSGISIAGGAQYTPTRSVQISLTASGSNLQMKFSDDSTFAGVNWNPYTPLADFQLSTGDGEKKVFAIFKNDFEIESKIVSDIILPQPMEPSIAIENGSEYAPSRNVQINLSASGNNMQMKISDDSTFTGVIWDTYKTSTSFQLSVGEGEKKVYAVFKNDFEIESKIASDVILPQPIEPSIAIADGSQYTHSRDVQINISASGSNLQMKVSEDSTFIGLNWIIYSSPADFHLSSDEGEKRVYAMLRNDFEIESIKVWNSIILDITPPIPVLYITPDSGITDETIFQLDPTSSTDNFSSSTLLQVIFDWENDGYWDTNNQPLAIINHSFSTGGGNKIVKMQLQDAAGCTADILGPVYVNTRPVASFTATHYASNYLLLHFDASASSDYEDGPNLQYRWDWEGDGNWDTNFSNSRVADYGFSEIGNYTTILQVRDSQNLTNSIEKNINVDLIVDWVTIPAGEYTFGQNDENRTISYTYQMMKYEVTHLQYKRYLDQLLVMGLITVTPSTVQGYYSGDNYNGPGVYEYYDLDGGTGGNHVGKLIWDGTSFIIPTGYEDHPVCFVTWIGAKTFAQYYGFDLPTTDEWEKAARGTSGWDYPWGDYILGNRANYLNSGDPFDNGTTPMGYYDGTKHDGFQTFDSRSPFGLYDMAGNVWEWTSSFTGWFNDVYACGGSWYDDMNTLRSWNLSGLLSCGYHNVGFRCIKH